VNSTVPSLTEKKKEVGIVVDHYEFVDPPASPDRKNAKSPLSQSLVAQRALDKSRQLLTRRPAASSPLKASLAQDD